MTEVVAGTRYGTVQGELITQHRTNLVEYTTLQAGIEADTDGGIYTGLSYGVSNDWCYGVLITNSTVAESTNVFRFIMQVRN